jgi:hypothetical protein
MTRGIAIALWATLYACEPAREPAPKTAASPETAATVAQPVAQVRYHIARPLHELTDSVDRVERTQAEAIGVVVPIYREAAPEELSVTNDTVYEIQTVARVRFYPRADRTWTDTIWTREAGLYGGLTRTVEDDYGLPVISVRNGWLRVHYAYAEDGSPRSGWVRLVPARMKLVSLIP